MMGIAFFTSGTGDTDLAIETILALEQTPNEIFLIPLTTTAAERTKFLDGNDKVRRVLIDEITKNVDILSKKEISQLDLDEISVFLNKNNIQRIYIGVPSINNEIPFQIASTVTVPCTIAYEYMFKPEKHIFWDYVERLASKEGCNFAVPLRQAAKDILIKNKEAKVYEVGHLSIDRSQIETSTDSTNIKNSLKVNLEDEFVFISGTTQPHNVDSLFLDALLSEISIHTYPNLQIRMGVHPGVSEPDQYIRELLKVCESYPSLKDQFKIIMTEQFEKKLLEIIPSSEFLLRCNVSGPEAAMTADKIAQAVPGALLNEAAIKGKPSFIYDTTAVPYLPREWFSENIFSFFSAKKQLPHSREELGLYDTAPNLFAKIMQK